MKPTRCFSGPLIGALRMSLKTILYLVMVGFPVSTALAQAEDLQLTCRFVRPESPVQKKGFIWKKDIINVEYKFTNVSGEHLLIPDPARYKPRILLTTAENDSLDFNAARIIKYCMITQIDYTLIELLDGSSMKFVTNVIEDTKEYRDRTGTSLSVFEGIEYPFRKGESYRVHSKFRSEMQGTMETYNNRFHIWNGEISCEDILEFKYE